jgi:hypothetical protein
MSSLINANPTVFAPSQTSVRKPSSKRLDKLWVDSDTESEDEIGESEPIDQQEVFGESGCIPSLHSHEIRQI